MKIGQIQQFFSSVKVNPVKNQTAVCTIPVSEQSVDTFEPRYSKEKEITYSVLSKIRKFTIKDYRGLDNNKIRALRTVCESDEKTKKASSDNIKMALMLKPYLDEKYGKDKYVFVSIGRSPAGIARVLEFMGVETKYLPISGLRNYPDVYCALGASKGLKEYGEFLKKQGISNAGISKSDKKYLFFDYTYTGKSLRAYSEIIRDYYGINHNNMHFLSIWDSLKDAAKDDTALLRQIAEYVTRYLVNSGIEPYGGVSELQVHKLFNINSCKKFESDKAKKFNFLIIDELSKKSLLKENPANKKSL